MAFRKCLVAVAAMLSMISGGANAEVITFQFTGTITYGGYMALPGNQITGTFSYDTNTSPEYKSNQANFKYAAYSMAAPFGLSAKVGNHVITTNGLSVAVYNNMKANTEDMVDITGYPPVVDGTTFPNGAFGFRLATGPGNSAVLPNTRLPRSYNISEFNAGPTLTYGFLQTDGSQTGTLLQFTMDAITVLQTTP